MQVYGPLLITGTGAQFVRVRVPHAPMPSEDIAGLMSFTTVIPSFGLILGGDLFGLHCGRVDVSVSQSPKWLSVVVMLLLEEIWEHGRESGLLVEIVFQQFHHGL